ncbi:hypothetical protein ACGFOM_38375 [Streptomyces sp. NPDC048594]|uniref:hypothetical protein n=1 Tax=Streptomyces sp. NPDC048594 TaxID=3365575 RepID=UPI00371FD855
MPYYEPWPALARETWRPDIRAAVLANQRIGLHRKLMKTAAVADPYPTATGADAIVYRSPGPSPLDVLPHPPEGKPAPGTLRSGSVNPPEWSSTEAPRRSCGTEQCEEHGDVFNVSKSPIKTDPAAGDEE